MANKPLSASWHEQVYHPKVENIQQTVEWKAIEKVIKARDKQTCQSCWLKIGLTVHHILPRAKGGTNYPPNLITLCRNCHFEIEELDIRDRLQILNYKRKNKYIKHGKNILVTEDGEKDWHKWVYGGYRRK